jgi:hypothetical protein
MGGPELTLAQKVMLLELNKIGLLRHVSLGTEVVDAQIIELGLLGAVRIENKRVRAVPSTVPIAPELRPAYEALMKAPSWPVNGAVRLAVKLPSAHTVAEQLIERGVLCRRRHRRLGVLPVGVWRTVDPRPRQELVERLRALLLSGAEPSPHDVALLLVLSDPSVARHFSFNEWETAKPHRIGIVALACPEGSFLRDFVTAKRQRWSDDRSGLIENLWDRLK